MPGPMAIAAVRDLDDTGARPPSVRDHDRRKNFDNETCHDPHINQ